MTRPAGRAAVEIVGDASKLGAQLQRDVDKALRGLRVDMTPVARQISAGLERGVREGGRAFNDLEDTAEGSLREIGRAVDRLFDRMDRDAEGISREFDSEFVQIAAAAEVAGESVGRSFKDGADKAEDAFREMDRVAGREFVKIAAKAKAASKSVDDGFTKKIKKMGGDVATALKTVLKVTSIAAAAASLLSPLVSALLATGKATVVVAKGLASLAPLTAFLPSLVGSVGLLVGTLKLAGPGLAKAFEPIKLTFVDLDGNATAITKTLQDLVSQGVRPLAQEFLRVNMSSIVAAMDQIAISTNLVITETGKWVNSASGQKLIGDIASATADAFAELAPHISTAVIALGELANRAGDRAITGFGKLLGGILDKFTAWANSKSVEDINAALDKFKSGLIKAQDAFDHIKEIVTWVVDNQATLKTFSTAMGVFGIIGGIASGNPFAVLIAAMGLLLTNWDTVLKAFSGDAFQAALPGVKAGIGSIVDSFRAVLPALTQFGAQVLQSAVAFAPLIAAFGPISSALLDVAGQVVIAASSFAPLVAAVLQAAPALISLLVPALQLVISIISPLLPAVTALASVLAGALSAAASAVAVPLAALARFFSENPEQVWILVAAFTAWAVVTQGLAIVMGVIRIATLAWAAAQTLLDIALNANPIGLVIAAIAVLVGLVIFAWKHSDKFRTIIIALWHGIEAAGKAIGGGFMTAVRAVGNFFASIGPTLAALPGKIGGALAALPGLIGRALAAIPGLLLKAVQAMFDLGLRAIGVGIGLVVAAFVLQMKAIAFIFTELPGIAARFFTEMFTLALALTIAGVTSLLTSIRQFAVDFWNALLSLGPLIGNFFVGLWQNAVALTLSGIGAVVSFLTALPGRALAAIQALPGLVRSIFVSMWEGAKSVVTSGVNAVVGFIQALPGRIAALGPALLSAGRNLISAFMNGLKSVGGFFADVGSAILGGLKSGLNSVIGRINDGIASIDSKLPFDLPRIPQLATGGLTTGEGLANLHPRELVLPLEDSRAVDLLAKALAEADAGLRAAGVPGADAAGGDVHFDVRVFIGDQELTDKIDVRISEANRSLRRRVQAGAGSR